MLHYIAATQIDGFETDDEVFGVNGFQIGKTDFDAILLEKGFNEADIESLGYEEIVDRINDEF